MIKPLSLQDVHKLCTDFDIAIDPGDYSLAMIESMSLTKLQHLVNRALERALATSTIPTVWSYHVHQFSYSTSLKEILSFLNSLTGADLVQVLVGDALTHPTIIYRIPII